MYKEVLDALNRKTQCNELDFSLPGTSTGLTAYPEIRVVAKLKQGQGLASSL